MFAITPHHQTLSYFFFYTDTETPEIYTLSLHDALPICLPRQREPGDAGRRVSERHRDRANGRALRSEEHTSELQSPDHLVCRLLLEKKKGSRMGRLGTETAFEVLTRARAPDAQGRHIVH